MAMDMQEFTGSELRASALRIFRDRIDIIHPDRPRLGPAILNAAPDLATLRALPSNRLEVLKGSRAGLYSIRINRQWCTCFECRKDSQDHRVLKLSTTTDEEGIMKCS